MRISDWSSDVCSSDLAPSLLEHLGDLPQRIHSYGLNDLIQTRRKEYQVRCNWKVYVENFMDYYHTPTVHRNSLARGAVSAYHRKPVELEDCNGKYLVLYGKRSEEHTSELQSLMRISYAVFSLKKKNTTK